MKISIKDKDIILKNVKGKYITPKISIAVLLFIKFLRIFSVLLKCPSWSSPFLNYIFLMVLFPPVPKFHKIDLFGLELPNPILASYYFFIA